MMIVGVLIYIFTIIVSTAFLRATAFDKDIVGDKIVSLILGITLGWFIIPLAIAVYLSMLILSIADMIIDSLTDFFKRLFA